ncbi:MAG: hypothetical protein SO016_11900 [Lachnospiraceae bacterium]|nr:hypothetical protein [Robinsoniella sp.]MDY3767370.1 hypothetical protein [Lachnospiraceae bacterium]
MIRDEKPRIMTGADIQKMVNHAQIDLTQRRNYGKAITAREWKEALWKAAGKCSVYGDGNENLDSVAISYCRMLRKGMVPTADEVLFQSIDYQAGNLKKSGEKGQGQILGESDKAKDLGAYDAGVYQILLEKINEIAPELEKYEKMRLLRG